MSFFLSLPKENKILDCLFLGAGITGACYVVSNFLATVDNIPDNVQHNNLDNNQSNNEVTMKNDYIPYFLTLSCPTFVLTNQYLTNSGLKLPNETMMIGAGLAILYVGAKKFNQRNPIYL